MNQQTTSWRARIDPVVFSITSIFAVAFVVGGVLSTDSLGSASANAQDWVITTRVGSSS